MMIKHIYRTLVPEHIRTLIYLKRSGKYFLERKITKVYSHPRSGTHFSEAFLAKNFYDELDLDVRPVVWGHWSNLLTNEKGNIYGKLFGGHGNSEITKKKGNKIYIYRDGRAVAYSIWNTENFLHKDLKGITFAEFLRTPLDWFCAPEVKTTRSLTIAEHWFEHVESWHERKDPNLLIINYEDLKNNPKLIYDQIEKKFFFSRYLYKKIFGIQTKVDPISKPLGLKPNKGQTDAWKSIFSEEDNAFFMSKLKHKQYLSQYDS